MKSRCPLLEDPPPASYNAAGTDARDWPGGTRQIPRPAGRFNWRGALLRGIVVSACLVFGVAAVLVGTAGAGHFWLFAGLALGFALIAAFDVFLRHASCGGGGVPLPLTAAELASPAARDGVVLVVHGGLGDTPARWPGALLRAVAASDARHGRARLARAVDWAHLSARSLCAPAAGARAGAALGRALAALQRDQGWVDGAAPPVHLVAHSVGSFVIDVFARAYAEARGPSRVKLTFLDPFCLRGLLDWWYGLHHFGAVGARGGVEHFFNADDPVPTTNVPLRCADVAVDVTGSDQRAAWLARERSGDGGGDYARWYGVGRRILHWWPCAWYIDNFDALQAER